MQRRLNSLSTVENMLASSAASIILTSTLAVQAFLERAESIHKYVLKLCNSVEGIYVTADFSDNALLNR